MSLRARIFIIASIVMLLILGVSIFLIINKNKTALTPENGATPADQSGSLPTTMSPASIATSIPEGLPAKTATPLEAEKNGVQQLAKVFVERYGTYSSDNNSQNIQDVQSLVTKSLWAKLSGRTAVNGTGSFVGMTTKVIGMDLTSWSDGKATVRLQTARTEEKNGKITTYYQNADVEMVKQDGMWLADKLTWN